VKHIVGFSGGVDSQAAARWVLNRFDPADVILTNSDAGGWEDRLTTEFIERYSETVHPVTFTNAKVCDMWETPGFAETKGYDGNARLTFALMCQIKGRPPSRKAQFCTEKLKLVPQRRWIRETFGPGGIYAGEEYCRYSGVRRDESASRATVGATAWDTWFDCETFYPIFDWTKKMCFDYLEAHGEGYNPLYKLGFGRVGCAPCINSSKADIVNWMVRRPENLDKVRELETMTGRTFFHPVRRDGVQNGIDDVLSWANTERGGKVAGSPFDILQAAAPACSSKYSLCE
jgi:3'-phosphoadenosine 5'-phosphosulfate sulfotransferase (PAPS reductase)/FAD synthetase